MKSPMSLRRYLSLQFGMIAALPVVIIAFLVWQFLMPQMRTNTGIQHEAIARAIAGQVSAHLMGGERQLVALANFVESQTLHSESELIGLLDAQCGNGDVFETIYIAANRDDIINSVGLSRLRRSKRDDLLGMDLSGRRFLQMARQLGKSVWSETFLSTASSQLAVAVTVPRSDMVVIGEITLDKLSEFISHLPVDAGLLTMVLDRRGRIVADSQRLRWGQQLNMTALPASGPDGEGLISSSPFDLDGSPLLGTMVDIPQLGWKVLVAEPIPNALKPLRAAFMLITLGLGVALILALVAAWFQASNLSRVFRSYAEQAQTIARGEYDLRWPPSKTLEFKHLGRSLKHMARMIRQREKALVSSETRMRITLDSIGDAVIATDAHGAITRMNPVAEKLTGWPSIEASGRKLTEVFKIVNAHTRQAAENPVDKVLANGEIIGLANHTMLIARDGLEYQIADSGAPIRHLDGRIVGVVLVFRDVTEAYAREQKIRDNEKLLKNITDNVPGVVFQLSATVDQVYTCRYVSPKASEIFGIESADDRYFEKFTQCMPESESKRFMASIREAVVDLRNWQYEGRFVKPSGDRIWFSASASCQRTGADTIFNGVWMDVTERRRLETALRLTQFSFDKAAIGIYRIGSNARILNVNEKAASNLGYSMEELTALSIFDIDPLVNSDNWDDIWQTLCKNGADSFETIHRSKDGVEMPVEISSNLLEYDGQQFSISFVQDISDRKGAEKEARRLGEALLQAQKMEAIGTLAGGIAHDFNNILSAVIGYTELALPELAPDTRVHRYVQQILTAGLRARDLVQQILTFSRKDKRQLLPLKAVSQVKEALKLLRSSLPATIEISQHIEADIAPVLADPTQIHQIVINLCTNAAHAMEADGGHLNVSMSQVLLSEQDTRLHPGLVPGEYLKISIQDTGAGISPDILQKIYDPYFTTKEKGKGTGLGLSVVHGIVQSYGGAINAYSVPNRGSTFNVYIPSVKDPIVDQRPVSSDLPGGDEHILLVDDEPALVDVGRQLLEKLGYRVSTADGSRAALELFRHAPQDIDLVVTDMTMPTMTGDKLAVELLKIRPDLPIILATGYSVTITAEKALKMGIKAFLHKPIVEADLAGSVRNVLDDGKRPA
jgi:two-component system cell cycle sensor histidine kinase/response regulator CckA